MSDREVEAVARALMKRWIDQANAERYEGGPHTSPMVEPEEYDIDDPPEGMWEQALGDAAVALDAVRSPQAEDPQTRAHEAEMRKEHGMSPQAENHPFGPGTGQAVTQVQYESARSPQAEDHGAVGTVDAWRRNRVTGRRDARAARSPQAEDHEAGVEAMRVAANERGLLLDSGEPSWMPPLDDLDLRALAAAYLSRCPSRERERDTAMLARRRTDDVDDAIIESLVAEVKDAKRDTERLVEALEGITRVRSLIKAKEIAMVALAEFSAGDPTENG